MLRKDLNRVLMITLVVGATIGGGIFITPGSLASAGGSGSMVGFIITFIGGLALAYVFSQLGYSNPVSNGLYEYPKSAFGKFMGATVGWAYWVFMWASTPSILIGLAGYLAFWIPAFDSNQTLIFLVGTVIIWIFTVINLRGIKSGATWGMWFTIAKLAGIAIFIVIGLTHIHLSNLTPILPNGPSSILPMLTILMYSFLGMESAVVMGEEGENKDVVRVGAFYSYIIIALLYGLVLFVSFGAMPSADLANSSKSLVDVSKITMGGLGQNFIAIIALISIVGGVVSSIPLVGRISLAMARDGFFPKGMASINKNGAPHTSLIVGAICSNLLLATVLFKSTKAAFDFTMLITTLFGLIPYALTMVSIIILKVNQPDTYTFAGSRWTKILVASIVAFIFTGLAIYGSGAEPAMWALLTIVIAGPALWAYLVLRAHSEAKSAVTKVAVTLTPSGDD